MLAKNNSEVSTPKVNYRKGNADQLMRRQSQNNIQEDDNEKEQNPEMENDELSDQPDSPELEQSEPDDNNIYSENNPEPIQTLADEDEIEPEQVADGSSNGASSLIADKIKKYLLKKKILWWVILFAIIIGLIILIIIILFSDSTSFNSILCGGSSEFDNLKVITTTQHVGDGGDRDYNEPLDSWDFYDYVKSVLYNEFSLDTVPERHAAYQAQAIAIASFAIHRGGYYDRMESNQKKFNNWCGDGEEWVKVKGVNTFKCPTWAENTKIIILPSSTDAQTTCDIVNGCYKYIAEENGCVLNIQKSKIADYNAPATWSRTCGSTTVTGTRKEKSGVSGDMIKKYDELISEIKGIFLTNSAGKISYGSYGSAGTTGCSSSPGTSMAMCHDRDNPEAIQSQAESGWSALRILNFWYKDAYLSSKSKLGIEVCQMYTSKVTDGLSMLNWTDNNGSNHVADSSFDLNTFLTKQNDFGLSLKTFNNNIRSAVLGAGIGSRMGVVKAATTYITTLASFKVKGSYDLGGDYHQFGVNPNTGKPKNGTVQGNSANLPISFDCTGFFYWALINGGINSGTFLLGNNLSLKDGYFDKFDGEHKVIGVIGDAMYHQNGGADKYVHVRLVIGHEFDNNGICISNITAESAGSNKGIIIKSYEIDGAPTSAGGNPYGMINMQACYEGREGCSVVAPADYYKGVDISE